MAIGYLLVESNYTLENDNILDLSHIEFLHPGSLGSEAVKNAVTEVRQEGNTIWSMRQTADEIMPDLLYYFLDWPPGQRVDRWIDVRWDAPSNMLLFSGATPTGRARSEGHATEFPQLFTPDDKPMLEAQQARMGDAEFWSLRPVLLASDAPAVRARRVLDRLIAAEQVDKVE